MPTATASPKLSSITQTIPCKHGFVLDLRRAAREYSQEVSWLRITPGTGEIIAYASKGVRYRFNCGERDGGLDHSMRDVLIGLGFFRHDEVPSEYTDSDTSPLISYSFNKPKHRKRIRQQAEAA